MTHIKDLCRLLKHKSWKNLTTIITNIEDRQWGNKESIKTTNTCPMILTQGKGKPATTPLKE